MLGRYALFDIGSSVAEDVKASVLVTTDDYIADCSH